MGRNRGLTILSGAILIGACGCLSPQGQAEIDRVVLEMQAVVATTKARVDAGQLTVADAALALRAVQEATAKVAEIKTREDTPWYEMVGSIVGAVALSLVGVRLQRGAPKR